MKSKDKTASTRTITAAVALGTMTMMSSGAAAADGVIYNPNRLLLDAPMSYSYTAPGHFSMDGTSGDIYGLRFESRGSFFADRVELGISYNYLDGQTAYRGTADDGSPVTDISDDTIHQLELHLGARQKWENVSAVIYGGVGVRAWFNQLRGTPAEPIEQVSTVYTYLPLGVRFEGMLTSNWQWETKLQYNQFVEGMVTSHFSEVDPAYNDSENSQTGGQGYEIAATFHRRLSNDGLALIIEPYYQVWDIDTSDEQPYVRNGSVVGTIDIPANKTEIAGVRLGIEF